ncbi:MAG TPA: HupE/UreJ family protein, partial [Paracoccaceae bacterium]|nr:HupE/UreJ family protein [Paracoccaceae bacterium]
MIRLLVKTLLFWLVASVGYAHEIRPAVADLGFDGAGGYEIRIRLTLEALVAGIDPALGDTSESENAARYDALRLMPPEGLQAEFDAFAQAFLGKVTLSANGQNLTLDIPAVEIPPVGDIELVRDSVLILEGPLPPNAQEISFGWDASFGPIILRAT